MEAARRILVTGACGFLSRHATARLAALPEAEVLAADRGEGSSAAPDVTDAGAVNALVARLRPTCVLRLAVVTSPVRAAADSRHAWDVNLFGTLNLAEAVLRHAPEARFLFAGSSEVYGGDFEAGGRMVNEGAPLAPRHPYAATKAAADLLTGLMAEAGLNAVRVRPFNHTGPGQPDAFAVPAFASQIAAIERGGRPPVFRVGNLDARRDFLDVRDVVEAYRLAVLAPDLPRGCVLNVASGVPRRMGDALKALLGMSATPIAVERRARDHRRRVPRPRPARMGTCCAVGDDARRRARALPARGRPSIPVALRIDDPMVSIATFFTVPTTLFGLRWDSISCNEIPQSMSTLRVGQLNRTRSTIVPFGFRYTVLGRRPPWLQALFSIWYVLGVSAPEKTKSGLSEFIGRTFPVERSSIEYHEFGGTPMARLYERNNG